MQALLDRISRYTANIALSRDTVSAKLIRERELHSTGEGTGVETIILSNCHSTALHFLLSNFGEWTREGK